VHDQQIPDEAFPPDELGLTMSSMNRWQSIWRSYPALPLWVQLWVCVLVVPNVAAFAFLHTEIGIWTAIAIVVFGVINLPTIYVQRGFSRLLSFPHFIWAPLIVFIAVRLSSAAPIDSGELWLGLAVLIVNLISLVFDVLDAGRWLRGQRDIFGGSDLRSRA
jgi:hypothetical protein